MATWWSGAAPTACATTACLPSRPARIRWSATAGSTSPSARPADVRVALPPRSAGWLSRRRPAQVSPTRCPGPCRTGRARRIAQGHGLAGAAGLALSFAGGRVEAELAIDGPLADGDLVAHVGRMIGLTQAVEAFEQHYRDHPQLGPLLARQSGLRVALAATPFEAL